MQVSNVHYIFLLIILNWMEQTGQTPAAWSLKRSSIGFYTWDRAMLQTCVQIVGQVAGAPWKAMRGFWPMARWMSQKYAWQPEGPPIPWDVPDPALPPGKGGMSHSVCAVWPHPQCWLQGLGATIWEEHKAIGEHPKDSYKDGERSGGQGIWGVMEIPRFVQSREPLKVPLWPASLQREWRNGTDFFS